jgi:hypothetical protein
MRRGIGLALLIVGIILIIWGFNATESLNSEVTEFFSGTPSNRAIWLLAVGAGSTIAGLFSLLSTSKK